MWVAHCPPGVPSVELIGWRIEHPTLELLNALEGMDMQAITGECVCICCDVFVEGAEGVNFNFMVRTFSTGIFLMRK